MISIIRFFYYIPVIVFQVLTIIMLVYILFFMKKEYFRNYFTYIFMLIALAILLCSLVGAYVFRAPFVIAQTEKVLRYGPDNRYPVLGYVNQGQVIQIVNKINDWQHFNVYDSDSGKFVLTGWWEGSVLD